MRQRRGTCILTVTLTIGLGLTLPGCDDDSSSLVAGSQLVRGSGVLVEESRPVSGITGVTLAGRGALYIEQGAAERLLVRAESNLIGYLQTEVRGGMLVIGKRPGYDLRPTHEIEFHLTVTDLRRVLLSGAGKIRASAVDGGDLSLVQTGVGDIDVSSLDVTRLDVSHSGVGQVRIDGITREQSVDLGGLGSYEARGLQSVETDVIIRDGGSATVSVRDRLHATIHGGGSVYYVGSPVVTKSGSGSGSVVPL